MVAGGRRKGPQGPRGAPACLAAAVTRCRRRGETSRRPGAGRDARGPARGRAPRALSPGAATPSSGRRPPPPIRPLSRPGTVSGTPSPRPASSAPGGRLFYLLCGCRRALLLTGRIPSRCRRCSCHPRRRRELPTPAPSGNPGNREHHPRPSPVLTQSRSPARARWPRLARPEPRPEPRPSQAGQRRRRRRDAWSRRANGEERGAGRPQGGGPDVSPARRRLGADLPPVFAPSVPCEAGYVRPRAERPAFGKHQALARRPLPASNMDRQASCPPCVGPEDGEHKNHGKGLGEGGPVTPRKPSQPSSAGREKQFCKGTGTLLSETKPP